jgi:exodeoxyribonuclease VII large subunit
MDLFDFDFKDEDEKELSLTDKIKANAGDFTIKSDAFKDENPLSVSQLSNIVKTMVEGIGKVVVQGEISNLSKPASGHIYFKIKDKTSIINAVIWKGAVKNIKFMPEEGLEVVLTGKLSVFSARSEYQINVSALKPAGVGSLMQLFEKRKAELEKEGLFDAQYKQAINRVPECIAIITSQTGDVFYDIMHRIEQRYPCNILLYPVRVQGQGADLEIIRAIMDINALAKSKKIDTIIIARGGGSIEDLWTFNEENVIRAAFQSEIPIISAIGHEPDYTLLDYVADLRAPTPTGAAELATYELESLKYTVKTSQKNLFNVFMQYINNLEYRLDRLRFKLKENAKFITDLIVKFDYLKMKLVESVNLYYVNKNSQVKQNTKLLESLSPTGILQRGYAFVTNENGSIIKSKNTKETTIKINFKDGTRKANLQND